MQKHGSFSPTPPPPPPPPPKAWKEVDKQAQALKRAQEALLSPRRGSVEGGDEVQAGIEGGAAEGGAVGGAEEEDEKVVPNEPPRLTLQRVSPGLPYNQQQPVMEHHLGGAYAVADEAEALLCLQMVLKVRGGNTPPNV